MRKLLLQQAQEDLLAVGRRRPPVVPVEHRVHAEIAPTARRYRLRNTYWQSSNSSKAGPEISADKCLLFKLCTPSLTQCLSRLLSSQRKVEDYGLGLR